MELKPKVSEPGIGPRIKTPTETIRPPLPREHLVGDMQSDMARQTALNKRTSVGQRYNDANYNFGHDTGDYNSANAIWDVKKFEMTQGDYDACFGHLQAAFAALGDEQSALTNAYGHIAAGDADFTAGDAASDPNKTPKYNSSLQHYNAADTQCAIAETKHTTFTGEISQVNVTLASYP